MVRLFENTHVEFGFDGNDVWTMFHSFAFDFSVWELWGALLHGGTLVLVDHEVSRDPDAFPRAGRPQKASPLRNQTPLGLLPVHRSRPSSRFGDPGSGT